ncbi:MAG TPA: hypothetical protein VGO97_00415, partial [Solirubrobacterales bacterium]|nr:hypothetical protein [Solirubrobacterales bacterium]
IDSKIYENARYSGGMDAEMGRGQIPMIVSTEKGVDILLKGVAAKKRIVTLPAYGHIFWWTYRLVPSLVAKTSSLLAMRMRKAMKTNK